MRRRTLPVWSFLLSLALVAGVLVVAAPAADAAPRAIPPVGDGGATELTVEVPSFHGLEPHLRLVHDQMSRNGWVGPGWSLTGTSQVIRESVGHGAPAYDDGDQYAIDGDILVPCASPTPVDSPSCRFPAPAPAATYATTPEGFERVAFDPTPPGGVWTAWQRDGSRRIYEPSLGEAPRPTPTSTWHLAAVEDPRGNRVAYRYGRSSPAAPTNEAETLQEIMYNGTSIRLHSQARPDEVDRVDGGRVTRLTTRLASIEVSVRGKRTGAYSLRYEPSANAPINSMLSMVTRYGHDVMLDATGQVTGGTAAPPIRMTPQAGAPTGSWAAPDLPDTIARPEWDGTRPAEIFSQSYSGFRSDTPGPGEPPFTTGDVDGDGRSDFAKVTNFAGASPPFFEIVVGLSTHTEVVRQKFPWPVGATLLRIWAGDIDGDGADDLFIASQRLNGQAEEPGRGSPQLISVAAAISTRDGHFRLLPARGTPWVSQPCISLHWECDEGRSFESVCDVGDVNGDGRADLVCSSIAQNSTVGKQPVLGVALSEGGGGFEIVTGPGIGPPGRPPPQLALGDVDGDGNSDALLAEDGETVVASLGTGRQFLKAPVALGFQGDSRVTAGDFNGDGRSDFLRFVPGGGVLDVQKLISQPDGRLVRSDEEVPARLISAMPPIDESVTYGDADGDGATDLLIVLHLPATGPSSCGPGVPREHVGFARVIADRSGHFKWPADWTACSPLLDERDLPFQYAQEWRGQQAPDVDGNGLADVFALFGDFSDPTNITYRPVDDRSVDVGDDTRYALSGDVDGDGRTDTVKVGAGQVVTILRRADDGVRPLPAQPLDGHPSGGAVARDWQMADVNADGRSDLVHAYEENGHIAVSAYLGTPDGTFTPVADPDAWPRYTLAYPEEGGRSGANWRAVDVNGDGRADLVHVDHASGTTRVNVLRSEGTNSWIPEPSAVVVGAGRPGGPDDATALWRETDIDGNGRGDLVRVLPVRGYSAPPSGSSPPGPATLQRGVQIASLVRVMDGVWRQQTTTQWGTSTDDDALSLSARRWQVGDVNGDGARDLVEVDRFPAGPRVRTLLSTGTGRRWESTVDPDVMSTDPAGTTSAFSDTARWRTADVNADGRTDLVHLLPLFRDTPTRGGVYETGLQVDTFVAGDGRTWAHRRPADNIWPGYDLAPALDWSVADSSGDGKSDLVRLSHDASSWQVSDLRSLSPTDLTSTIDNGLGARTTYDYAPSSAFATRNSPTPPESGCALPATTNITVVRSITTQVVGSPDDRQTFDYRCAGWSYRDQRFLGWQETTTTHAAASNRAEQVEVRVAAVDETCRSRPLDVRRQDADGRVLTRESTEYVPDATGPTRCLPERVDTWSDGDRGSGREAVTEMVFDPFGNRTTLRSLGDPTTPRDDRLLTTTYPVAPGPWIVGAPGSEELTEGAAPGGPRVRLTLTCYDGDNGTPTTACASTPPTQGLPTATKELGDGGVYRTTVTAYDPFGSPEAITDPRGNTKTIEYDPDLHTYPTKICDALKHCSDLGWDVDLGELNGRRDPNGAETSRTWTALGELRTETLPGRSTVTTSYLDWANPVLRRVRTTAADGSADGLWSEEIRDGLGRTTAVIGEGDRPGSTVEQRTAYSDASGRPASRTRPITVPSAAPAVDPEQYSYDPQGRLVGVEHPDHTEARRSYTADPTAVRIDDTDEDGTTTTSSYDAHDRLVDVTEHDGARAVRASYTYDAADQLGTATDAAGNTTTFDHDPLGQVRTASDPDRGTWSRTYDAAGNVETETDARGRVVTWTHDPLDRPLTRTTADSDNVTWRYDESNHGAGIGRLTSVDDASGRGCPAGRSRDLSYLPSGQLERDSRCVTGVAKTMAFGYDDLARRQSVTYPDGERLDYHYDASGQLHDVPGLVDDLTHDASGRPATMTRSNATTATWGWNPARDWLDSMKTTSSGGATLLDLGWGHEPDGLTKSESTGPGTSTLGYQRDGLERLTDVRGPGGGHVDWLPNGSVDSKSDVGGYSYPPSGPSGCRAGQSPCAQPRAPDQAGNRVYGYDANGNLTSEAPAARPVVTGPREYVVESKAPGRRRDTLWAIARDQLDDPQRWPEIFELNRGAPQPQSPNGRFDDPNRIYPGQRLTLPGHTTPQPAGRPTRTMVWNDTGRLAAVDPAAGPTVAMTYDAAGERVEKRVGTARTRYFGPWFDLASNGQMTKYYYADDEMVARRDGRGLRFYDHDRLGSVRMLTTGDGRVSARPSDDAFGVPRDSPDAGDLRFAGMRYDQETGYLQMGARYYDPRTARFLSPDSLLPDLDRSQGLHPYQYAYGDPTAYVDPSGFGGRPPEVEQSVDGGTVGPDAGSHFAGAVDAGTPPLSISITDQRPAAPVRSGGSGAPATYGDFLDLSTYDQFRALHSAEIPVTEIDGHSWQPFDLEESNIQLQVTAVEAVMGVVAGSIGTIRPLPAPSIPRQTPVAGSIRRTNPTGSASNCVNCALATDATLAGRPAVAMPGGPTPVTVLERIFRDNFKIMTQKGIESTMITAGPGARGIVFGKRGPGVAGHVFNVVNQKGVIRYLDGQSGKAANLSGYKSLHLLRTN